MMTEILVCEHRRRAEQDIAAALSELILAKLRVSS